MRDEMHGSRGGGQVPRGKHCRLALHSNATRINVRAVLYSLRHPYVLPTLEADFLPGRDLLLTFRPFSKKDGSLRDRIHRVRRAAGCSAALLD